MAQRDFFVSRCLRDKLVPFQKNIIYFKNEFTAKFAEDAKIS